MPLLPTRSEWQQIKKKYGIPDKVTSFSIGEKLDGYAKVDSGPDLDKKYEAWNDAGISLTKYEAAFRGLKPEKFAGKTSAEKQANFNKAHEQVKDMLTKAKQRFEFYRILHKPLDQVNDYLYKVVGKYKSLKRNDSEAISSFFNQELRNTLGTAVNNGIKTGTLPPNVLNAFKAYQSIMDELNAEINVQKTYVNHLPETYKKYGQALDALMALHH